MLSDPRSFDQEPRESLVFDAQQQPKHVPGTVRLDVHGTPEPSFVIEKLAKDIILGKPFLAKSFKLSNKMNDEISPHPSFRQGCRLREGVVIPPRAGVYATTLTGIPAATLQTDGVWSRSPGNQFITPYSLVTSDRKGSCGLLVASMEENTIYLKDGTPLGAASVPGGVCELTDGGNKVKSALGDPGLTCTNLVQHSVPTDPPPIAFQPRRVAPAQRQTIARKVDGMLQTGIIIPVIMYLLLFLFDYNRTIAQWEIFPIQVNKNH